MSSTTEQTEKDRDDAKAREYNVDPNRGTKIKDPADSHAREADHE